jgi:hypothetical protein
VEDSDDVAAVAAILTITAPKLFLKSRGNKENFVDVAIFTLSPSFSSVYLDEFWSPKQTSPTTSSSTSSTKKRSTGSSAHSPSLCARANTASPLKDIIIWLRLHAQPPSRAWLRPSSQNYDPTPDSTLMENLLPFYNAGGKGTDPTTLRRNHPVWTKRYMCLSQPSTVDWCHQCEPSCIGSNGVASKPSQWKPY